MIAAALAAACRLISGAAVEWRCDPLAPHASGSTSATTPAIWISS